MIESIVEVVNFKETNYHKITPKDVKRNRIY